MSYSVFIIPAAEKELDRLPAADYTRIIDKILSLEENPRTRNVRKLTNREEYRLRVGFYRILYTIDDENHAVTIMAVGHRRDVYR